MMSMANAAGQMKTGGASQASTPSATSSRVGTSLPRTARARLGQCGMRKRSGSKLSASNVKRGDELPRLGGSGQWAAHDHDSMIAPCLYSDGEKSTLYSSLSREAEHKPPSSSPGTESLAASAARKESKSKRAAKAKGKYQPQAPMAKLNPRNLRFIQQAQRRGLDHIRPARFNTMAVQDAVRNGILAS